MEQLLGNGRNAIEKKILELYSLIQDLKNEESVYEEPLVLLRWLRNGGWDVAKAEKLLRRTAKWRREFGVIELKKDPLPAEWVQYFPMFVDSLAYDGTIASQGIAGGIDLRSLFEKLGRKQSLRYLVQAMVHAEGAVIGVDKIRNGGKPITEKNCEGGMIIVDAANVDPWQVASFDAIRFVKDACMIFRTHFPIFGSSLYVVNLGGLPRRVFNMVRQIVECQEIQFRIYGEDKNEWQPILKSLVPADQLRKRFGGTKEDFDGLEGRKAVYDQSLLDNCRARMAELEAC